MSVEGTILVVVRNQGEFRWYRSPPDFWVLSYPKWEKMFTDTGYDVLDGTSDSRFGILVVDETNADVFLSKMAGYEVNLGELKRELESLFPIAESWWDVEDLFPGLYIDFDNTNLAGFYDQSSPPFEKFVPDHWSSKYIDFCIEYPEADFPRAQKFWINQDGDMLEELNRRGRALEESRDNEQ